jgi:hypothetical protein
MIIINQDNPFDIRGENISQWMVPAIDSTGRIQLFTRREIPGMVLATGSATLANGSVTIGSALIGPNAGVFAFHQLVVGSVGFLRCSARVSGVSFTITSANPLDNSIIAWMRVSG